MKLNDQPKAKKWIIVWLGSSEGTRIIIRVVAADVCREFTMCHGSGLYIQ